MNTAFPTSERPPLRVVIVDEELPYPPNSGKRIRSLNLTLRLAHRHRLTYIAHRHPNHRESSEAEAFFHSQGIEVLLADRLVPPKSGFGFYARLAGNLCSHLPYSVQTHTSQAMQQLIREHQASHPVDLWHCEWTPYAENLRNAIPDQPFVVMAHNIESQIWQRYASFESNPLKRWYILRQWSKFERFERHAFAVAQMTIVVSPADAALARSQFKASCVEVVENGVDLDVYHPSEIERKAGTILFLGSLDWRPNLDAVTLLLDEVFPRVLQAEPAARLCLVGRNPPGWLADRVQRERNVELHENVPDVRPFLWQSSVMAVPLRIGGGSRLKILEALACACPVVSTSLGAEGLDLIPGKHYMLACTVEEMAQSLQKCLSVPKSVRSMTQCGREVVLRAYNWDILSSKLERIWHQQVCRQRKLASA
jgi:glycosyltransferase involved in cell wall biosynthesis